MFVENFEELEIFSCFKAVGLNAMVEVSTGLDVTSAAR